MEAPGIHELECWWCNQRAAEADAGWTWRMGVRGQAADQWQAADHEQAADHLQATDHGQATDRAQAADDGRQTADCYSCFAGLLRGGAAAPRSDHR